MHDTQIKCKNSHLNSKSSMIAVRSGAWFELPRFDGLRSRFRQLSGANRPTDGSAAAPHGTDTAEWLSESRAGKKRSWCKLFVSITWQLTSPCVVMIDDEASTGKLMIDAVAAFNSASYEGELMISLLLFIPLSIDSFRLASWRFSWFAASILKNSSRRCFFWVKNIRISYNSASC